MRQTSTRQVGAAMLALALLAGSSAARIAQAEIAGNGPWEGWHQPLADGIEGLRFGMDRFTVVRILASRDFHQRSGRPGTLRYEGEIRGARAEIIAEFAEEPGDGHGGRLSLIKLHWDLDGTPSQPYRIFEELDSLLQQRYEEPLLRRDPGVNTLSTGNALFQRIYQGPEMRAFLELRTPRTDRYQLLLTLQSPQLAE